MSAAQPLSPIQRYLEDLHARLASQRAGELATYIPELADADPDSFGICLATTDGHVYEVGDSRLPFTIQSISKPFAYGLALGDQGGEHVLSKVGVEPTGEAFNSIRLAADSGRPLNPMVNSCHALPLATFERLGETRPDIKLALLGNLLANVCQTVARLTHEVATLAQ